MVDHVFDESERINSSNARVLAVWAQYIEEAEVLLRRVSDLNCLARKQEAREFRLRKLQEELIPQQAAALQDIQGTM